MRRNLPDVVLLAASLLLAVPASVAQVIAVRCGYASSDLALYANALYNTGWGRGFLYTARQAELFGAPSFLADHFAPSLALLAPWVWWGGPTALAALGAWLPVLSAWLAAAWARSTCASPWQACAAGLAVLGTPLLWLIAADPAQGFHHDGLIPAAFFLAAWAWVRRSPWFWVLLCLLLGLKEDLPVAAAWIGILGLALRPLERKRWAGVLLLSLAWAAAPWAYVAWTGAPQRHLGMIGGLWQGPGGDLARGWRWSFWWPLGWLNPWSLAALLPEAWLMATLNGAQRSWRFLAVYPLLAAGQISLALRWARSQRWHRWGNTVLGLSAALMLVAGADEMRYICQRALALPRLRDDVALAQALAGVPETAALLAPSSCLVALYRRPRLLWPGQEAAADFVLTKVDPQAPFVREDDASLQRVRGDQRWVRLSQGQGYELYGRRPAGNP